MYRHIQMKSERSMDSFLNKWWRVRSEKHDGLKGAMYNFMIVFAICALAIICLILRPFVRPLLWAFLIGAALFPFKRKLAFLLNEWFDGLEKTDTNVFVAIAVAPVQVTENFGAFLIKWFKEHWRVLLVGVSVLGFAKIILSYAPRSLFCWIWKVVITGHTLFAMSMNLITIYLLIAIIVVYLTSVHFLWTDQNSQYFLLAGQSLWMVIVGYACSFLGPFQVPAFLGILAYIGIAIIYNLKKMEDSSIIQRFANLLDSNSFVESIRSVNPQPKDKRDMKLDVTGVDCAKESEKQEPESENMSNFYFKLLFYACLATFLYRNLWVFILAMIPISLHLCNIVFQITGIWEFVIDKLTTVYTLMQNWAFKRHSAILPLCLPGILDLNYQTQIFIRKSLKSSVDLVTSVLMIFLMILIVTFVSVSICVNIYSETIEVAYLGKDLINKTITDRPELIDVLPANIQSSIDDVLDNAHHYGRRKIETYIDDILKDVDPVHGEKLKVQILNVWDRIIQYWMDFNKTDTFGPRVPTDAIKSTFGEIVDNPGYFKELVLVAQQGIIGWAKSNTNTILEVAESLWHIIRTNISMIMAFTTEIFSLVLSSGQAFVEFLLDTIVFFTALFYLLSSSNEKYAPLQIPSVVGMSQGPRIAEAIEDSISGVLIAMFKSAVFTGLFTWLTHTILGARIVFLPSAFAAFFSAAPFLGSYWCAIPAFLELWLAQDRFNVGIVLFLLLFFVPPYVEQEIHSEMKGGGHPYLTGLAIAGGMYWLGWQGAIFGPLLLCFFVGIFEVAAVSLKADESKNMSFESPVEKQEPKTNRRHSSFEHEIK